MKQFRLLLLPVVLLLGLGACANPPPSTKAEQLVDDALRTLETFRGQKAEPLDRFPAVMRGARGVVIMPEVVKAAFFVGGEGGNGVLLARRDDGTWSYPAFYTMGAGSLGFQLGGQASEMILILRSDKAVEAMIKHQGKFGADLEMTGGTGGAGVEGSTTANLGADIVVFSKSAGFYGGASLEGAVLGKRNDWNEGYYGVGATPEGIVLEGRYANAKADSLRASLARF